MDKRKTQQKTTQSNKRMRCIISQMNQNYSGIREQDSIEINEIAIPWRARASHLNLRTTQLTQSQDEIFESFMPSTSENHDRECNSLIHSNYSFLKTRKKKIHTMTILIFYILLLFSLNFFL